MHTLIPEFTKTPEAKDITEESFVSKTLDPLHKDICCVQESWDIETLRDDVETSADNESSAVLYANIDSQGIFLCGDAGIRGLSHASEYTDIYGQDLPNCNFYQIPHHGGRHNVSPEVLNKIVGEIRPKETSPKKSAFVSVGKEASKHPKEMVVNAFIRRGAKVTPTKGSTICNHHNTPARSGWTTAKDIPFSDVVESWD